MEAYHAIPGCEYDQGTGYQGYNQAFLAIQGIDLDLLHQILQDTDLVRLLQNLLGIGPGLPHQILLDTGPDLLGIGLARQHQILQGTDLDLLHLILQDTVLVHLLQNLLGIDLDLQHLNLLDIDPDLQLLNLLGIDLDLQHLNLHFLGTDPAPPPTQTLNCIHGQRYQC